MFPTELATMFLLFWCFPLIIAVVIRPAYIDCPEIVVPVKQLRLYGLTYRPEDYDSQFLISVMDSLEPIDNTMDEIARLNEIYIIRQVLLNRSLTPAELSYTILENVEDQKLRHILEWIIAHGLSLFHRLTIHLEEYMKEVQKGMQITLVGHMDYCEKNWWIREKLGLLTKTQPYDCMDIAILDEQQREVIRSFEAACSDLSFFASDIRKQLRTSSWSVDGWINTYLLHKHNQNNADRTAQHIFYLHGDWRSRVMGYKSISDELSRREVATKTKSNRFARNAEINYIRLGWLLGFQ